MPHAEHTTAINRPVDDVFSYLADGMHNREWRSGVLEIERTSSTDGVGATYRQVLAGPGGRRIDGDFNLGQCPMARVGMGMGRCRYRIGCWRNNRQRNRCA